MDRPQPILDPPAWCARWWYSHVFCAVFFVPVIVMFVAHEVLGITDELGGHRPGRPFPTVGELLYNLAMVGAFYFGVCGYIAHAWILQPRGSLWLAVKLFILAIAWYTLLTLAPDR